MNQKAITREFRENTMPKYTSASGKVKKMAYTSHAKKKNSGGKPSYLGGDGTVTMPKINTKGTFNVAEATDNMKA